jgi:hypothetical protein
MHEQHPEEFLPPEYYQPFERVINDCRQKYLGEQG